MASIAVNLDPATAHKIATAKQLKDTADQAFKAGKTKDALMSYHQSLMYLIGLDKNALKGLTGGAPAEDGEAKSEEKTEVDELIEKIYANQSACHLKNENWQRALETASKALEKNGNNYKAMFRKGKALGELGFFEKSEKVLEELKSKSPADAQMASAEITRLRAIDQAKEKAHAQRLKGFLSKKPERKKAPVSQPAGEEYEEITSPGVASSSRS